MSKVLHILLIVISVLLLFLILRNVIKNKMNIHYAMIWIIWGIFMLIIAIFPEIVSWIGNLLGIQVASNTIFLIMIFLLYCLMFYVYLKISRHNEDIINLNYEIASLKKKVEELEKKK